MVSPFLRPVCLLASSCAVVLSLTWSVLLLLGILTNQSVIDPLATQKPPTHYLFAIYITCFYFRDGASSCRCVDNVMTSRDVLIILGLNLATNVVWCAQSSEMLYNVYKRKWQSTRKILIRWLVVTAVVLLLDLGTAIAFGIDYHKMLSSVTCLDFLPIPATLMSIAVRGYVLWVIYAAVFYYLCIQVRNFDDEMEARTSRQTSTVSAQYQQPFDFLNQENHSIGRSQTTYATPYSGIPWSVQSPQVGNDMRTSPWTFQSGPKEYDNPIVYQTPYKDISLRNEPPIHLRAPPPPAPVSPSVVASKPPRQTVPPAASYIPPPDYDDFDYPATPEGKRQKHEPRPFDEVPKRSALKKPASHLGRTVF